MARNPCDSRAFSHFRRVSVLRKTATLARICRKSPARTAEISVFEETIGGDWFDRHCAVMLAGGFRRFARTILDDVQTPHLHRSHATGQQANHLVTPQFICLRRRSGSSCSIARVSADSPSGQSADFAFDRMGLLPVTIPLKADGLLADLKQSFAD
jgi:hypothetical protein